MKIHAPEEENELGEISQTIPALFSFFTWKEDGSVQRLHEWVKCRDFLGDVLHANKYEKEHIIYGFKSSHTRTPIAKDKTQLLLKFPSKEIRDVFLGNMPILHSIEAANELPLTKLTKASPLTYLVEASDFWQLTIPFISFYTFVLKAMMYKYKDNCNWEEELSKKDGHCVEKGYMRDVNKFRKVKSNLHKIVVADNTITGENDDVSINSLHNAHGFVSVLINTHLKKNNKYSQAVEAL